MKDSPVIQHGAKIDLWPQDPPGALGRDRADRPYLQAWYRGESSQPRPAVIVCPGGGYNALAEHEGKPVAEELARWGLAAFVLHYRVKPYMLDAALADGRRAVRLLRYMAGDNGIDPEQIVLLGFSAGGHLGACISTIRAESPQHDEIDRLSDRPDALACCYAPVSLVAMGRGDRTGWLLGENPPDHMRRYIELDKHVTSENPPTFLWHTAEDTTVPVEQSILFADALSRAQLPTALHICPRGRHGVGLTGEEPCTRRWPSLLRDWLVEIGLLSAEVGEVKK